MRAIAALLAAATTILIATEAVAQHRRWASTQVNPRCVRMKDPVACTCALQNGGNIGPWGYWHYSARAAPAFTACMQQAGRAGR
jgi:hypothetical protein